MTELMELPRNEEGIAAVLGILKQRFGDRFETGQSIREPHGHTTTWVVNQPPDGVVFVESEEEVQEVVQTCIAHRVPIIPFGTGTSLEGHVNAPAGGVSVDFSRMDQVLQVNAEDMDVVIQPGVTRDGLNTYLRDTGLFFPPSGGSLSGGALGIRPRRAAASAAARSASGSNSEASYSAFERNDDSRKQEGSETDCDGCEDGASDSESASPSCSAFRIASSTGIAFTTPSSAPDGSLVNMPCPHSLSRSPSPWTFSH